MKDSDPFRSPDALIEHLCGYMKDNRGIAALVRREFGECVTENNVLAARRRLAKASNPKPPIEHVHDTTQKRWENKAANSNTAYLTAILRAAG